MKTGRVNIDLDKLREKYPFSTDHINEVLSDKTDVYYEVNEQDNRYYEPHFEEVRVRIHYKDESKIEHSFTLLLSEEYVTFVEDKIKQEEGTS